MSIAGIHTHLNPDATCGAAGAVMDFLRSLDSGSPDAAQQAAESMSQWDAQTGPLSDLCGTDSILCQTLAHIVRRRLSSPQQSSKARQAVRLDAAGDGRGRRAGRQAKQRGKRLPAQFDKAPMAEPMGQGLESQGALKAVQAEEKRLHAAAALFGSEGLHAAVPMIADLHILQECQNVLQLSPAQPSSSAPPSSPVTPIGFLDSGIHASSSNIGTLLIESRGTWQNKRANTGTVGARIADVRPSLHLERLYRVARLSEQLPNRQQLLLATADRALCSGNFRLAEKLLGRASQTCQGSVHAADCGVRMASLQVQLHAVTDRAGLQGSATQLFNCLQSGKFPLHYPQQNSAAASNAFYEHVHTAAEKAQSSL